MSKRILIIDDEEILLQTFSRLLEAFGYETCAVPNAQEALLLARADFFELVICDVLMPGQNGFETIRELRELCGRKYQCVPPVILIAGFRSPEMESKIKVLSPSAVLWKPFGAYDLLAKVGELLGGHKSLIPLERQDLFQ